MYGNWCSSSEWQINHKKIIFIDKKCMSENQ